ncbi:MAG: hypothetical protein KBA31_21680 [Alphaproteobacteria bacterium]|nr:hypothetical protein [Alphaproteobacteria bacterium]
MKVERGGALALIAGTAAMLGVMALHPSGVGHAAEAAGILRLGFIVHAVAIGSAPVLTFGTFAISRNLGFSPAAALAFFFYLFGAIMVVLAATMSGFVATKLIELQLAASGTDRDMLHAILRLEWILNQSFATLHVVLFSAAIALYAFAWPDKGALAAAVKIVGFIVGIGVFAWLVSGTLTLNVHGMGAVVILQGAWFVLAAVALLSRPSAPE